MQLLQLLLSLHLLLLFLLHELRLVALLHHLLLVFLLSQHQCRRRLPNAAVVADVCADAGTPTAGTVVQPFAEAMSVVTANSKE
jgi:hypothetical protein